MLACSALQLSMTKMFMNTSPNYHITFMHNREWGGGVNCQGFDHISMVFSRPNPMGRRFHMYLRVCVCVRVCVRVCVIDTLCPCLYKSEWTTSTAYLVAPII